MINDANRQSGGVKMSQSDDDGSFVTVASLVDGNSHYICTLMVLLYAYWTFIC